MIMDMAMDKGNDKDKAMEKDMDGFRISYR
jgi:hypothetical protein